MSAIRRRRAVRAWGALLRVYASVVPDLDARMQAESGLPLSWYDLLLVLSAERDGRLRMGDLAECVVLSRTRVSRVVDELVAAGLVVKEVNPLDRRSAYAVITDQGRARQRAAAPGYLAAIEHRFATGLSDEDLDAVADVLERVVAPPRG